ncbi:MAG: zf-HC2 protein [Frankiales bacterium]|jgi:predicted anti-sigma-YlaC factor YlaD|nr:zf-HC2 protein [Frankiales bacterium]
MSRLCDEVQAQLPGYVDRSLPRVRRRLVGLHLRRCSDCQAAFSAQRDVAAGLRVLSSPAEPPPEGLLDELLAQAAIPGVKGRAAVPVRGAVSGARPVLSVALLVAGAAAGTGVGYAGWRGLRRLRER